MNFWRLLFKFVPVYKWRILFYILLNVLCSVVSIITFSAVIPLLYILFGLSKPDIDLLPLSDISSLSTMIDVIKNNILYYLQEQITNNGTITSLLIICTFVVITSFISNIVSYFAYFVRIPIRTGIARDLRFSIYDKLVSLPLSSYRKENKGDFVGRMTTDIEEVDFGIGTAMDMLIENPVQIIIFLITLFGISVSLASSATILLVIVCSIVIIIGHYMKTISLKGQSLKGKLISMYEETIEKSTIIQVFNLKNYFLFNFQKQNEVLRKTHNRMNRVYSIAYPLSDFMSVTVMTIVLFIGGNQVAKGNIGIDAAELIYFIIIFHSIIRPTRSVVKATYGIRKAMASLDRMEHILNLNVSENKIVENPNQTLPENGNIIFKNLKFGYSKTCDIFNNLNACIPIGKSTIIVGQNGTGKTTLIRLLLKLETTYEGDIFIGGHNLKDISTELLRNHISYVPQEALLFNDTIRNNILLGDTTANDDELYRVAKLVGLHDFILSTEKGYDTVIGEQGMNLSGGQKQCISIARALLKNAPIMILDEATAGIDHETEHRIINTISKIMQGKTLICISHSKNVIDSIQNHLFI